MKLILHGTLREFGKEHNFKARTVAEAVEGLSRQIPNWPREMVIDIVGYDTIAKLTEETDEKEIHLVPRMYGGGGKFGGIIMGVALVGLAIALPAAGGLYFAGTAIGLSTSAIFMMGASLMLTGVMQLFNKAPSVSKSNDPAASKYLGVTENTTQIGTPITLAWGRVKLGGHWLSMQSNADQLVFGTFPANPT